VITILRVRERRCNAGRAERKGTEITKSYGISNFACFVPFDVS
jgi:hypothetical protein